MSTDTNHIGRSYKSFTVLDWVGVAIATFFGLAPLFIRLVGVPSFSALFEEFEAELPIITKLVFTWWFAAILSIAILGVITAAVFGRRLAISRFMAVLAFLLGLATLGFYMFALYAPLMIPVELVK